MEPERIKAMRFAENNRISHRQLFRQIILVFPAPFLLCLFKNGAMLGISAMAGTAAAAVVLSFYVIWLIRLTPAYGELSKRTGSFTVRFIGLFFLVYVIASSAFLSGLLGEVIPESLISGISGKWLSLLAVAACSLGTHRGMQRRGRIAEVSGRIFLAGILLLMLFAALYFYRDSLHDIFEGVKALSAKTICVTFLFSFVYFITEGLIITIMAKPFSASFHFYNGRPSYNFLS